jgi:hypothetical protein
MMTAKDIEEAEFMAQVWKMNDERNKSLAAKVARPKFKLLDIYSPAGTKAYFIDENGYDSQREEARKFFTKGQVLTVKRIDVESWSSSVTFEELPGKWFNTVMFGVPKTESETQVGVGVNPLPEDAQEKLAEFLNWFDTEYETTQGTTALFWELSHLIGNRIKK